MVLTSNRVIHGKTGRVSDETVRRVTALLEERQYIPSEIRLPVSLVVRGSTGIGKGQICTKYGPCFCKRLCA